MKWKRRSELRSKHRSEIGSLDQDQVLLNHPRLLGSFYNRGINRSHHAMSRLVGPICWCGRWFLHHFWRRAVWEKGMRFCLFLCSSLFWDIFMLLIEEAEGKKKKKNLQRRSRKKEPLRIWWEIREDH